MGYTKHTGVIVTHWDNPKLHEAHKKAKEIFAAKFQDDPLMANASQLISDIIPGITNSQASFFIAPDGSKEGWSTSDMADEARKEFLDWLLQHDNFCDYIEVRFGGDDDSDTILRSKDMDLSKFEK